MSSASAHRSTFATGAPSSMENAPSFAGFRNATTTCPALSFKAMGKLLPLPVGQLAAAFPAARSTTAMAWLAGSLTKMRLVLRSSWKLSGCALSSISATLLRLTRSTTAKWSMRPRTSPSGIFLSSRNGVSSAQPGGTSRELVIASAAISDLIATSSSFALISTSVFWGYRQAVEGSDRIGLGPKPNAAGSEPAVAVVEQGAAIEPATEVVAVGGHAQCVPLAQHRRHDRRAREHVAASVVVVEPEIVLGRIRAHEIVAAVREAKNDAAGCVLGAGDRLESHGPVDCAGGT